MKRLLLLGGTAEAIHLAKQLHQSGIDLIYSLAGLVRQPDLPCQIVSGGFTQFGGLAHFLQDNHIDAILDVTHPYAEKMSATASRICQKKEIPLWRFLRQEWQPQAGDNWCYINNWQELFFYLEDKKSVFLSAGQLDKDILDAFDSLGKQGQQQILRTAVKPAFALPASMTWLKGIGPFNKADEEQLFHQYAVDALVCKNSGGDFTKAKLGVAREKGVPVYLFNRPELLPADKTFNDLDKCAKFIMNEFF